MEHDETFRTKTLYVLLVCATFLAAILSVHALSSYNFYPDSYVSLMVAENIQNHGSVVGTFGEHGMWYPDFVDWTRPMYPLAIIALDWCVGNAERSAHAISLLFGVLATPLTYFLITRVFYSKSVGLLAALLLATSYSHTIWSGFILTDTTGVFILLVTVALIFHRLHTVHPLAHPYDAVLGVMFALSVLTRYEYVLIALPMTLIFIRENPCPLPRLTTIFSSSIFVGASTYALLAPFTVTSMSLKSELNALTNSVSPTDIVPFLKPALHDLPLSILACCGFVAMMHSYRSRSYAYFALISLCLLAYAYFQTNPYNGRYFIHFIPFLILLASGALVMILQRISELHGFLRALCWSLMVCTLCFQAVHAYNGLRTVHRGVWFLQGYEADAAEVARPLIQPHEVVVASFPEPYRLIIGNDTQSVADRPPFLFMNSSASTTALVIIEDEGMRTVFPEFSATLQNAFAQYKVHSIPLTSPFRYGGAITTPTEPLHLYRLTLAEFKNSVPDPF